MGGLLFEGTPSVTGERVVLRAAVVFAVAPLRLDPPLLLQLVQGGVERPLAHLQDVIRHLGNALRDSPAMRRLKRNDLQNQEVERALHEIGWFAHS